MVLIKVSVTPAHSRKAIVKSLVGQVNPPRYLRRAAEFHYLASIPPNEVKAKPTRKCRVCKATKGSRKETRYVCGYCEDNPPPPPPPPVS